MEYLRHACIPLSILLCSCGSGNDGGAAAGGGSGTSGPKCTITVNGTLMFCYDFGEGYNDANVGPVCDVNAGSSVGARVSSCPTGNIVGTCPITSKCGGSSCVYNQISYGSKSVTCESAKKMCDGVNTYAASAGSSTFVGNGCGTNAGGYAGADDIPEPTLTSEDIAATCVLSAGTVTSRLPCKVSMVQLDSAGSEPHFSVKSGDSGMSFSFFIFNMPAKADTYINDGARRVTCEAMDRNSRQWKMYDQFTGLPNMGSYTLRLSEVTMTATSYMGTVFSTHGSLDVSLDPATYSGATGAVSAHVDF